MRIGRPISVFLLTAVAAVSLLAQSGMAPVNDAPNPYQTVVDYLKLPAGRTWGSTAAVEIDKDGRSIWVAERCAALNYPAGCYDPTTGTMSTLDPILKFDPSGRLVKSFGSGMMAFPHGIYVDPDGNIWVTDGADNAPRAAAGAPAGRGAAPQGAPAAPRLVGAAAGACAAVVAGIQRGLLDASVRVHTRGGELRIHWSGHWVTMTGPAVTVFHGEIELDESR